MRCKKIQVVLSDEELAKSICRALNYVLKCRCEHSKTVTSFKNYDGIICGCTEQLNFCNFLKEIVEKTQNFVPVIFLSFCFEGEIPGNVLPRAIAGVESPCGFYIKGLPAKFEEFKSEYDRCRDRGGTFNDWCDNLKDFCQAYHSHNDM